MTGPGVRRLEVLYRERRADSLRLAHLLVGDRAQAEELVHDAFLRVLPRIDELDNPAGYLRTVLVNACRDAGRRATRAKGHPSDPVPPVPPPDLPLASSAVWAELLRLPERQRIALCLRFYDDLPDSEIAEILDVRPATVRSLVHRGLATLKEAVPHD